MKFKDAVAEANVNKYLKAPTWKEIKDFINEIGITDTQFERYYSLPKTTLSHIRLGKRDLPKSKWHIIYEKIVPSYGNGYTSTFIPTNVIQEGNIPYKKKVKKKIELSKIGRLSNISSEHNPTRK